MKFVEETLSVGEDLLKCLRVCLSTNAAEELSFSPERWAKVADLASKAGVAPFLFRSLPITDSSLGIPRDVITRWFREYLVNLAWNNTLAQHLEQVLDAFNREGIPVILLKGVYLMDFLYPERGMRTVGDIDILIPPGDKDKALVAMLELGYSSNVPEMGKDPVHCRCIHPTSDVTVEVHLSIDARTARMPDVQGFWERCQPIKVGGNNANALSPDDLLVHLCLHLSLHLIVIPLFPQSLRSLLDIGLLILRQSDLIRPERVVKVVLQTHGGEQFLVPIQMAGTLLSVPTPVGLSNGFSSGVSVPAADINLLKNHLLFSCERNLIDARIPPFVRSSIMADKANTISGFLGKVFVSRATLARRYGESAHWYSECRKYLMHFRLLMRQHFAPGKWAWGKETLTLTRHFKGIADLKGRISP